MPELQLSYPRKRHRLEPIQLNETSQLVSKKQRLSPPSGSQPPANIRLFARHGGLDLSDRRNIRSSLRSGKRSLISTSSTKPTTNTTDTKSTGVYNRDFQQHMVDYDVYPDEYEYPNGSVPAKPNHWEKVNQIFAQSQPSLSPFQFTNKEFRKLKRADAHAAKEKQVSESVIPIIKGKIRDAKCRLGEISFTNLNPLTDSALKFKPGNPNIYYNTRPEQLSQKVRNKLSSKIIPSTQHNLPLAPNFFLAIKEPDGSAAMYTSHITPPHSPRGRPEYHMTQLNSFTITSNKNNYIEELQANKAIKQANKRANYVEPKASAGNAGASPALSFVTTVSETEAYTISQESQTFLNNNINTREDFEESDSLIEKFINYTLLAKRSSKRSKRQRKRRNADISSSARHSNKSTIIPNSQDSAASNVTTK
ncbi:hypothetical protein K469DRAFT_791755 [Zopfia rhizophila CBS 207.26]|uniref:Uncharacterized protein n=1 Tax=Zopfia rhizophila CBS 207.26 TaxID=1314779 RepID=A0A6A6DTF6_9PEZI|nr:hypothetical protein K469DRAFT_791755 [Zopfia rhizophila CBS 207.26]